MESTIYESFILPSKGLVYDKPINANITLRSMTTLEEMKRLSPTESPYKVMSDIIEDCMKEKPDIHVYDMSIADYQFLLHKLRIVTYGPEYKMIVECPDCKAFTESIADLDSIAVHDYDNTFNEAKLIVLPKTNKQVELRLQTPRDFDMIAYKNKEMQKRIKSNLDYSIIYTIMSCIKKIDGRVMDSIQLEEIVKQLPMRDITFLMNKADELTKKVGLDTSITVKCANCGHELITNFRLTSEFFGPTAN